MPAYLLDKNHVRKAIAGIAKLEAGWRLEADEVAALFSLYNVGRTDARGFISVEMHNILKRIDQPAVKTFVKTVEVLYASRYFKRWARRLQDYDFTPEDAKLLALGTFGTDAAGGILGVDAILTFDKALINNFQNRRTILTERLAAMTSTLDLPFSKARLPDVHLP